MLIVSSLLPQITPQNSIRSIKSLQVGHPPILLTPPADFAAAHKSPSFLAINPMGTVPAATDSGCTINESNAILQYAADTTPSGHKFYPADPKARAHINKWLLWEASVWFNSCYVNLVEYVVKPLLKQEPDEKVVEKEAVNWNRLASVLEKQLAETKWLGGEELSIAE